LNLIIVIVSVFVVALVATSMRAPTMIFPQIKDQIFILIILEIYYNYTSLPSPHLTSPDRLGVLNKM